MKLIVFGYRRHGKDTASKFLDDTYGLTYSSSSEFACERFIFDALKDRLGYASKEECFEDRVNHRALWYDMIRDFNKDDEARLGRLIFAEHSTYCGIRSRDEFYAIKEQGLFDMAIWIDAGERLPPEDASSNTLCIDDADYVIENNGTEDALYERLGAFYQTVLHPHLQIARSQPHRQSSQRI